MRMLPVALLAILACLQPARAEVTPSNGVYDPRVKTVVYNANDVVSIIGHYGFSTNVEFAATETVQSIALGDSLAWEVAPRGNQLFVKPREDNATTNMTVITDQRSYHFWLDATKAKDKGRGEDMYFRVKFLYPQEAVRAVDAVAARRRVEAALEKAAPARNWNYWACGDKVLLPSEAYDDGRFTYLRYPGAQEIPAAFVVNSDGAETLASGVMRGDQLVLQVVASKLILRRGRAVACLENRGFDPYGVDTPSGTTSPLVERRIRDEARPPPPDLPEQPQVEPQHDDAMRDPVLHPLVPAGMPRIVLPQGTPASPAPAAPASPLVLPQAVPAASERASAPAPDEEPPGGTP